MNVKEESAEAVNYQKCIKLEDEYFSAEASVLRESMQQEQQQVKCAAPVMNTEVFGFVIENDVAEDAVRAIGTIYSGGQSFCTTMLVQWSAEDILLLKSVFAPDLKSLRMPLKMTICHAIEENEVLEKYSVLEIRKQLQNILAETSVQEAVTLSRKTRWTDDEKDMLRQAFRTKFKYFEAITKEDVQNAVKSNILLPNRTEAAIMLMANNLIKELKKRKPASNKTTTLNAKENGSDSLSLGADSWTATEESATDAQDYLPEGCSPSASPLDSQDEAAQTTDVIEQSVTASARKARRPGPRSKTGYQSPQSSRDSSPDPEERDQPRQLNGVNFIDSSWKPVVVMKRLTEEVIASYRARVDDPVTKEPDAVIDLVGDSDSESEPVVQSKTDIVTVEGRKLSISLPIQLLPSRNTSTNPEHRQLYLGSAPGSHGGSEWVSVVYKVMDRICYQCYYCSKVFDDTNKRTLAKHTDEQHGDIKKIFPQSIEKPLCFMSCRHCDFVCMKYDLLFHHFIVVHGVTDVLSAIEKKKSAVTGDSAGNYVYKCCEKYCVFETSQHRMAVLHMLNHHPTAPSTKSGWVQVRKVKKKRMNTPECHMVDTFLCAYCTVSLQNEHMMNLHCLSSHNAKHLLLRCNSCGEQFVGSALKSLANHVNAVHNDCSSIKASVTVIFNGEEDSVFYTIRNKSRTSGRRAEIENTPRSSVFKNKIFRSESRLKEMRTGGSNGFMGKIEIVSDTEEDVQPLSNSSSAHTSTTSSSAQRRGSASATRTPQKRKVDDEDVIVLKEIKTPRKAAKMSPSHRSSQFSPSPGRRLSPGVPPVTVRPRFPALQPTYQMPNHGMRGIQQFASRGYAPMQQAIYSRVGAQQYAAGAQQYAFSTQFQQGAAPHQPDTFRPVTQPVMYQHNNVSTHFLMYDTPAINAFGENPPNTCISQNSNEACVTVGPVPQNVSTPDTVQNYSSFQQYSSVQCEHTTCVNDVVTPAVTPAVAPAVMSSVVIPCDYTRMPFFPPGTIHEIVPRPEMNMQE